MGRLSDAVNIGEKLEKQLIGAGIESIDELKAVGAKEAWIRIKATNINICSSRIYALEGAIRGIKRDYLPDEVKEELKAFCKEVKK